MQSFSQETCSLHMENTIDKMLETTATVLCKIQFTQFLITS